MKKNEDIFVVLAMLVFMFLFSTVLALGVIGIDIGAICSDIISFTAHNKEICCMIIVAVFLFLIFIIVKNIKYKRLESEVLEALGFESWKIVPYFDAFVAVKSRRSLEKYDDVRFFKEYPCRIAEAENMINEKSKTAEFLKKFDKCNDYKERWQYERIERHILNVQRNAGAYRVRVSYTSPAGRVNLEKVIAVNEYRLKEFKENPSLLMSAGEYGKYLREQQKEALNQKYCEYYGYVNEIIDYANKSKDLLLISGSVERLDSLISKLFDRTVNSIKKIKKLDSEEWGIIKEFIDSVNGEITALVDQNQKILEYYASPDFFNIKEICKNLMSSQREFNEYVAEKIEYISGLFGTRVVRNETENSDEYNYIRPYKKTITPFTAEVSAAVFASAENNPLEYVVKNFYPDKKLYPEQIQKLYSLVEELETLKEAKQIIENYKEDYRKYLSDVPNFVMENDEKGFFSRLGLANIDDSMLTVEYKFVYTSGGGMAQRSFTIPMTEETIAELIRVLESKLTASAFVREQRTLMTVKLRNYIKMRDNYTCRICGNSIYKEPNLLLEIDHIIPVSKGGGTSEENLQTLCWKCNRAKSNKITA